MAEDNSYAVGAGIVGVLVGIVTFFGCWIYAIDTYGWFLGLAFGWIPSAIIAFIVGALAGALWPLLLIAVLVLAWFIFKK